jgi:hypothetical protein
LYLALNSQIKANLWRTAMLLSMCALVFMFALRAKTSGYNGDAPPKVTPSTASKLWLSGQKMEVQSVDTNMAVRFWMTVVCLFGLFLHREPRVRDFVLTPAPSPVALRYLHRFLRPPPVSA